MEKIQAIRQIEEYLAEELKQSALEEERKRELESLLLMYRFLPKREYGPDDPVIASALVELDLDGKLSYCLIVPKGGGLVTRVENQPLQVVTPNSPLGEALLGRRRGDFAEVEGSSGVKRRYRIVSIS